MDDLFRAARLQLASSAYAARPIPFESMIMSMLIMQQRMIRELQRHRAVAIPAKAVTGYVESDDKAA